MVEVVVGEPVVSQLGAEVGEEDETGEVQPLVNSKFEQVVQAMTQFKIQT